MIHPTPDRRPPTVRDWAAALGGYVAEAYGMEMFETADLIAVITATLTAERFDPNPPEAALPLRVREQITSGAELARGLSAESIGRTVRVDLTEQLLIDQGIWADFMCRYLELSEVLRADKSMLLWRRLVDALEPFDLATRPVIYLSVPLQQALPFDSASPVFDVRMVV